MNCLGCGESTDGGELCPACRVSARRQMRVLAAILIVMIVTAVVALVATA